ncbi:MAG: TolB family protein, partial [Candidatus Acidiferrales bacterium]
MRFLASMIALAGLATPAHAQRETVLRQIDLPHNYYYREMYLPQLTTGPSSVAWWPDSKSVVYSMGGTLWRQRIEAADAAGSTTKGAASSAPTSVAEQLTDGPGYHYQPDVSPDGEWIVFTAYDNDALELRALHAPSGRVAQLTSGGAVN